MAIDSKHTTFISANFFRLHTARLARELTLTGLTGLLVSAPLWHWYHHDRYRRKPAR